MLNQTFNLTGIHHTHTYIYNLHVNHKICVELIIRRNIIYGTIYIHCFTAHWVVKLCHRMECCVTRSVVKAKRQISATQGVKSVQDSRSLRRENTNARLKWPSVYLIKCESLCQCLGPHDQWIYSATSQETASSHFKLPWKGPHPSHPGSKYRKLEACLGSLTQCLSRTKEQSPYIKPRTEYAFLPRLRARNRL